MRRSLESRRQLFPASSDRYSPPFSASTIAKTRSGFAGETATPIFPLSPVGIPGLPVSSTQVSPPSLDFQTPPDAVAA